MFSKDIVPFVNEVKSNVIGFDRLWDDMINYPQSYSLGDSFPKDNIIKDGDNVIIIELALAGYDKKNINIERDGNFLTVSADKVEREKVEGVTYTKQSIATRAFTKRYSISADYKDIKARMSNGILSIHLEKEITEDSKQSIKIK